MIVTKIALTSLVLLFISGCSSKYIEVESQNEIPSGPGMFSGPDGGFTYSNSSQDAGKPAVVSAASETSKLKMLSQSQSSETDARLYEEFRAYQAFILMKKNASPEYQEFQEWIRWKSLQ